MISSLTGTVQSISLNGVVIDTGGVGYFCIATPRTLSQLIRGEKATILTTMVVREDAISLYGFLDPADREIFSTLQSVSGLGPRLALACLSVFNAVEIAQAISTSDTKTLQRIPGVGKRMADRMVLDLKEKMEAYTAGLEANNEGVQELLPSASSAIADQVIAALVGLGFTEKQANLEVTGVLRENPEMTTAQALRAALAQLGAKK
ncbi:Holliday junction branch migration protein RuvA [Corynebacterium caspium]|uniref:Holliday junction branch migration protein RuvA n=1 Tax=Corynebacterium caspium TaxID=234828 RepID=UPI00038181A7|nr:Holliday junction branch migration protein RuvA [Corynebacterium caspium]WKD59175.1 Holliday junction ATP-dependent DNA helicase RuvA [Corynebacterium caspium DSM 44850]